MIKKDEPVMVLESMKMETPLNSPFDGQVVSIHVSQGQQVPTGAVVATIKKRG